MNSTSILNDKKVKIKKEKLDAKLSQEKVTMTKKLTGSGFEVLIHEYIEQLAFPSEVILAKKTVTTGYDEG